MKNKFLEKIAEHKNKTMLLLEPASETLVEQRLSICKNCQHLFEPTYNCKKCGCFLKVKTKFKNFSCPLNKW